MKLETKNLGFYYKKNEWILRGVTMSFHSGSRTALLGESGSGKTTLAKLLAAWLHPSAGAVLIDGAPQAATRRIWQPVQLVSQHPEKALNPRWKMSKALAECYGSEDTRCLREKLGIEEAWLDRYSRELSGGEMQRFCIARALHPQTRFIIADEISAMFDALTQARLWTAMLDECKRRGIGIIAVTHDTALANTICNECVMVNKLCEFSCV